MATKKTKVDTKSTKVKAKSRSNQEADDGFDEDSEGTFPVHSLYNDVLDDINFKLADADSVEDVQPMSTGSLQIDYILGGGIRPSMYTYAGGEQSSKTTHAILLMASAINHNVPIIAMRDFEGCVTRDTKIQSGGEQQRLDQLFTIDGWEDMEAGHWYNQFADVDTVDFSPKGYKTRVGRLYYKGVQDITEVEFSNGVKLRGHKHPVFVKLPDGTFQEKFLEDLNEGDVVLARK